MSEQIVTQAHLTIVDNNDIESIIVEYARNQSTSEAPASGWSTTRPAWAQGYYIWQRTRIHKSGTQTSADTFGTAVCLTGSTGQTGQTGATGQSLSSTKTQYTNVASNVTITTSNHTNYTWTDNVPVYDSSKPVYWGRITNIYVNPAKTEYLVYKDQGTTDAIKTSNDANTTAGNAWDKADNAEDIAQQASDDVETLTTTYNTFINTQAKYFVRNSTGSIVIGSRENESTPVAFDVGNVSTYGYNSLMAPSQISLRYNDKILSSWSATALTFYKPSTTSQGAKAMELTGSALKFYNPTNDSISMMDLTSSGLTFKTAAGATIGTFGSDSSGGLLDLSGRLNIKGGGRIGQDSTNYWEFGDNAGYNVSQAAYLLGKGNASIQLGENGHWRIDKNRIHTGWYVIGDSSSSTPAGSLHFDTYNIDRTSTSSGDQYYWDYGIHFPVSNTTPSNNKFLYIRYSNTTVATTTLSQMKGRIDNDNYWNYKFYVDDLGNVHAPGFYIGDSTTPIGGGAGTVAERLTQGYGSATQPIYFNSNGVPTNTTYTLNAAGAKGVDTSISAASTSTNLPTSQAVAAFVEGKGYITSYVDNKVQTSQANTTKIYLAGTSTAGTTTGTLNYDSNIYADTTAGALHATTFNGYTLAAASAKGVDTSLTTSSTSTNLPTSKAVVDLIKQYLPLTGGSITGPVNFGDSVSADELTVGNLIINGVASFTNNLQANTINGVEVGNSPKFTDTTYTFANGTNGFTVTPLGGTAQTVTVTPSISNNITGTGTRTSGYLVKFSGTNTVTNGPALGTGTTKFLREDGTWVVPAGTGVTSVAASGSGGITISGSPITTSGTITIGLNLSTAINGLAEGSSNANRNDYIVAQYAGGGTTATTYHRRKLSNIFAALNSSDITTALGYTPYDATNPDGYTTNTGTVTSVKVQGSNGLTGSGTVTTTGTITLSHSDTSSQASSSNSGRTYIQSVTLDGYGHVTGLSTATETVTDTHHTANLITGASATAKANAAVTTNGSVYLNLVENDTVRNAHKIVGSGTTTVTSDADGVITISSADSKTGTVTSITLTQGTGISIGSSGTAITTSGTRTVALADNYGDTKNPYASKTARYVLAAPANAAGAPSFRALTGADVGLGSVLNATQVTGIGQGADGKIRVYKGDSNYEDVAVEIVATESSSVASAQKLTSYGGSTKQPVYFPNSGTNAGKPVAIGYTIETSVPSGAVFTDTTYTFTSGTNGFTVTPLNGNAQTVTVTPSITNNVTGSGTSGYLAKFNGANTITNGPALGTDATKFLNNKGEWATPGGSVTGVKGNSESTYRTGQVNITKANIGLGNVDNTADANKNVLTATKFSSSRTIALTGDATGSASGDGSSGWSISTTVSDDSHYHTPATIKPLKNKTFTDVIGTENNWTNAVFFYGSVKPNSWDGTWRIKYRIHVYVPNHPNYNQTADVMISGSQGNLRSYYSMNTIGQYYVCYYHELYRLKNAGFTSGYGHSIGVRFYSAYNPIDTNYKRTIEVEIYETDNCTFDFYDSCFKYSEIPGTGTTNYDSYSEIDFVNNGLRESGDDNTIDQNRIYYSSTTAIEAIYRYQMVLRTKTGQLVPVSSANNTFTIGKTYSSVPFDPFGEIYYFNSGGTIAANGNLSNAVLYRQVLADMRYAFDITTDAAYKLTARQPVYLTATPQADGSAVLTKPTGARMPLTQSLPTSDDGLIYIYLGQAYEETNPYRVELTINHPIYWYKNGAVRPYLNTGYSIASNVPSNAVFTDTHVNVKTRGTTKAYLLATTTSPTTSNQVIESVAETGVYLDTTAGKLVATTFSGSLSGNVTGNLTGNVTGTASGNVTSVQYDSTNTKFTYTKNGTNTDIATIANLKTYLGLGAAAYKGIDTSMPSTATDNNVPTTKLMKSFVEGKGYVTSSGVTSVATSSPITGGTITGTGTIGHATSGVGTATTTAGFYKFKYDTYGHVTGVTAVAKADITGLGIPGSDTDTKNTAGSTDTNSALFLVGATSQAANPQTYSHDTVKINSTGQIISTGYEMTTSSSMSNAKCQMKYDDSLQAIVFSFA